MSAIFFSAGSERARRFQSLIFYRTWGWYSYFISVKSAKVLNYKQNLLRQLSLSTFLCLTTIIHTLVHNVLLFVLPWNVSISIYNIDHYSYWVNILFLCLSENEHSSNVFSDIFCASSDSVLGRAVLSTIVLFVGVSCFFGKLKNPPEN